LVLQMLLFLSSLKYLYVLIDFEPSLLIFLTN
jgi:hypothetical protein